ncbi:hypothetical protein Tco_0754796 [Tanacetum coccineum]
MAGFLSRLVTKICRVLTTRKTVDDDEVAPRRNKVRTFKVPDQNLLTTRTMDDEDAPGLKAVPNFQVPDEVEPEDVIDPAEMNTLESRLGSLIQHDTITRVPAFKDIHGLALAIVLERLNSHGAFPEVHDKTRATGTVPTVKSTSKIKKCTGYGSKPESYVSSMCVEGMESGDKEFETNDLQSTIDEVDLDTFSKSFMYICKNSGLMKSGGGTTDVPSASTEIPSGFNHVEAKGFEFLAPTTRRNSMRVLQAMQLKKPVLLEASPCVGKTSLVLALGKFSGHSGLQINFSEQVIAEYLKRRNSWPKTNV